MKTNTPSIITQFAKDIDGGLSSTPKTLPSRYFYDAIGDKLFQQIMRMPEYYLTDCEFEIFEQQRSDIINTIYTGRKFNLVELGAGDGLKTKLLLEYLVKNEIDFEYFPVDISANILEQLESDLRTRWPSLKVTTLNYEYFEALEQLNKIEDSPKVILFLGSNIGNFTPNRAQRFFSRLEELISPQDFLLSGIDLKKNPRTILKAYDDAQGITRNFNLNLLTRINRELGANFILDQFEHYATYNPENGEARSYLMSTCAQEVYIDVLEKSFSFVQAEPIHTEISRKYNPEEIKFLANETGFKVVKNFTDSREYFTDTLPQSDGISQKCYTIYKSVPYPSLV